MKMKFVYKTTKPVVIYMRITASDERPSMSSVFHEMQKSRENLKVVRDMKKKMV